MTLFYIDLQSSITNHSLYLDRILADILWFNISNLRRWYILIYIHTYIDRFDQVVTLDIWIFLKKKTSGIDFQIVSSTLIFVLQVWIVNFFFSKLYYYILMIKYNIKTLMIIIDDIVIESKIKFKSYLSIDLHYYWRSLLQSFSSFLKRKWIIRKIFFFPKVNQISKSKKT